MRVRVAMRSAGGFIYCEGSVPDHEFGIVLNNLYHNDSGYLIERFIRSGAFGVSGAVLKRRGSTCKRLESWEVLSKECTVLFYDKNINYLCSSPFSVYRNSVLQKMMVQTYNADRYSTELQRRLAA